MGNFDGSCSSKLLNNARQWQSSRSSTLRTRSREQTRVLSKQPLILPAHPQCPSHQGRPSEWTWERCALWFCLGCSLIQQEAGHGWEPQHKETHGKEVKNAGLIDHKWDEIAELKKKKIQWVITFMAHFPLLLLSRQWQKQHNWAITHRSERDRVEEKMKESERFLKTVSYPGQTSE